MLSSLNLFYCETSAGNRSYEYKFQWWLLAPGGDDVRQSELETLIGRATSRSKDDEALLALVTLLENSLARNAYDLFLKGFAPVTYMIFYDNAIASSDGFTDFERSNDFHYPKFCLFKFASFLDLLRPGHIHWRGQPDPDSMHWASVGLRKFQEADRQGRASIISRWIRQPGVAAFSEKRAKASSDIQKRRIFLWSLSDRLRAKLVAQHLDNKMPKKPGGKYSSYTEWYRRNPASFESWLSKQRKDALNTLSSNHLQS